MKIHSTRNFVIIAAAFLVLAALRPYFLNESRAQLHPSDSSWPTYRGKKNLAGRAEIAGPQIPDLPIVLEVEQEVGQEMLSPILANDSTLVYNFWDRRTIYIEHLKSGRQYKFDIRTGTFKAPPVAGKDEVIYVGSTAGWFYAINTTDGTERWSVQPKGDDAITSSASVSADGGSIYVVTSSGFFCVFSKNGKRLVDPFPLNNFGPSVTPTIDDSDRIYVARGPQVYAFYKDGSSVQNLDGHMSHPGTGNFEWIMASSGLIFVGSKTAPFVMAFNADNGTRKWFRNEQVFNSDKPPALSPDGRLYLLGSDDVLKVLDIANDGNELSSINRATFTSIPVIDALGRIYLVATASEFFGFGPDHREMFRLPLSIDAAIRQSPAFGADGTIYIPGYGALYVVRPQPPYAKKLVRESGDGQPGCAGSTLPLPLRVRVLDQYASSFTGQRIDFHIVAGGGSLDINTAPTGSDGMAQAFWKLGTETMAQKVEARIYRPHESVKDSVVVFTATRQLAQFGGDKNVGFKKTLVKDTSSQVCIIRNDSDCPLPLQSLQILNDARAGFSICAPKPGETIPPRGSVQICLSFAPKGNGDHTAILQARSSVTNPPNYEIILRGLGEVDDKPPGAPENFSLADSTQGWRNTTNIFVFIWNNPPDSSGVRSVSYKVGGKAPISNEDKDASLSLIGSAQLRVSAPRNRNGSPQSGKYPVYVWLADRFGNVDFKNFAVDTIRFDNAPPALKHKPPENLAQIGQPVPITIEASDSLSQMESVTLFYRAGGELKFTEQRLNAFAAMTALPARVITMNGAAYYIIAKDRANNSKRFPEAEGLYHSVPVAIAAEALEEKHDGGARTTANRLRSFPLSFPETWAQDILGDAFELNDSTRFRLRDIDSLSSDSLRPLREYPHEGKFKPGNAMFLLSRNNVVLKNPRGNSANTGEPFVIGLRKGWNFVASPFNFAIPFQNSSLGDFLNHAYTYDGAWQPVTPAFQFKPWKGLAIKIHDEDPKQLVIWPVAEAMSSSNAKPLAGNRNVNWSIPIRASGVTARDTVYDALSFAGVAADAAVEWDPHEQLKTLPVERAYVAAYFPHRQWRKHADFYATDIRPPSADGYEWRFEVQSTIFGKALQLNFDVQAVPPEYGVVWLIDETLSEPMEPIQIDLRRRPVYRFRYPAQEAYRYAFRLVARTGVNADKSPADFATTQNFPNPFNAATTIQFSLRNSTRVSLRIYSLKGELIRDLIKDEEMPLGFHTKVWDGQNEQGQAVPSGGYFYKFKAGQFQETQKVLLIK